MAGARRSTRQSAATAPKYVDADSSASEEAQKKRNAKKATRRKRAREDDAEDAVNGDSSPPPKKKAAKQASKPTKQTPEPTTPASAAPPSSLEPTSPSNRTSAGAQEVYWLLKAEPLPRFENGVNVAFSIDDLAACTAPEPWSGVRNPQACKNMRAMRKGDLGLFYHSNGKPSGVAGILRVVEEAKVDETAFDSKDAYYDKKSEREHPKWYCVGVEFVSKFEEVVDLATIKGHAVKGGKLENMQLVKQGRLSVNRVRKEEWDFVLELAGEKGDALQEHKGNDDPAAASEEGHVEGTAPEAKKTEDDSTAAGG
ncbi:hypothetical protein PMIN06_010343 [Paraphaeosphaeria minitans]|uniref:Thymocyte nuclear protein 1 n=1 Tax=Paraphaeosphaeria minitans TaxID=565426 RepID=A0A9P6GM72_9PLEO|nr:at dna binding protein [Paraphaeosphaeria minitans]